MTDPDDFLYLGYLGDLTTLRDLQLRCGFSLREAADACLVSPETFRRWRNDRKPNPTAVRLLAILAGYVPWSGWRGWEMHRGLLFPPGYRRGGIGPGDIYAMPFERQLLAELKRQHRLSLKTGPSGGRGDVNRKLHEVHPVGVAKRSR
jgi:transcriptional regulator with XRE-family HTH domain